MEVSNIVKDAITILETATFKDVISTMVEKQTNSLLVVNQAGELVGEINMSDILDAIVPEYLDGDTIAAHFASSAMFEEAVRDADGLEVSTFMSKDTTPVLLSDGLMAIAATAIANKKVHIPVIDEENRPIGIISRRGIKHIIADALNIKDTQ